MIRVGFFLFETGRASSDQTLLTINLSNSQIPNRPGS